MESLAALLRLSLQSPEGGSSGRPSSKLNYGHGDLLLALGLAVNHGYEPIQAVRAGSLPRALKCPHQ